MRDFGATAERWVGVPTVWIQWPGRPAPEPRVVESSRAYRDRLVLKLAGIDGADAAARLRGATVLVAVGDAPRLPEGVHHRALLVGLEVRDEGGRILGRVRDVQGNGIADVLVVVADGEAQELLIPMAREIVRRIDEDAGWIEVRLPEGLRELNQRR